MKTLIFIEGEFIEQDGWPSPMWPQGTWAHSCHGQWAIVHLTKFGMPMWKFAGMHNVPDVPPFLELTVLLLGRPTK